MPPPLCLWHNESADTTRVSGTVVTRPVPFQLVYPTFHTHEPLEILHGGNSWTGTSFIPPPPAMPTTRRTQS